MALLVAYCLEINQNIDAELAYDLFWDNVIRDKTAFKCPDPNCDAQVTCANMDIAMNNIKQIPHFRVFGKHSKECEIEYQQSASRSSGKSKGGSVRDNTDEFLLAKPIYKAAEKTDTVSEDKIEYRKKEPSDNSFGKYNPRYFTIRSLVSRFIDHRQKEELEDYFIKIQGIKISYKDLFVGVYNQPLDKLSNDHRVYWGVAYFNRNDKMNSYNIRFENELKFNAKSIRPNFFLADNQISQYSSRLIGDRIKVISEMKMPRAFVFIYGKPTLITKDDKTYINFKVGNLDLIDIKDLSFFEELKK